MGEAISSRHTRVENRHHARRKTLTAIWHDDGRGWRALAPTGYPAEAALHDLVEGAPQLLPLAGSPRLSVVGREVILGSGKADPLVSGPQSTGWRSSSRPAVAATRTWSYTLFRPGCAPSRKGSCPCRLACSAA
jgi:hypothetical protein